MFRITDNKGFQMKLPNGCTVSVQWGPANYCEKKSALPGKLFENVGAETWESRTAEVAAWDDSGVDHNFDPRPEPVQPDTFHDEDNFQESCRSNTVKGWLTVQQVLEFINDIAKNGINKF